MEKAQTAMAELVDGAQNERAVREYGRIEERFAALGGYAAESDAARICAHLGLPERVLGQTDRTRSRAASAAASSWPGSCSPPRTAGAGARRARPRCCSTSPRTTSTPTRSPGCARSSPPTSGGLVVISHDTELLAAVVNKVWFLDATRGEVDVYNMDWRALPGGAGHRREAPPPRARQRREEGRRRCTCRRRRWARRRPRPSRRRTWRAARTSCSPALEPEHKQRQGRAHPLPRPGARAGARRSPRRGCRRRTARWRSSRASTWPSTAAPRSSSSGLNGAGKTTLLRLLAGAETPDTGEVVAGPRAAHRLLRPGARHARHGRRRCGRTSATPRRTRPEQQLRTLLGSFMFTGEQLDQRAGTLSGRRAHPARARRARVQLGERAAARRAHQQPRPGQPRSRCSTRCGSSPAPSCSSPTTPARSRRSRRTRSSCCRTAPRTSGRPTTSSSSSWPDRDDPAGTVATRPPSPSDVAWVTLSLMVGCGMRP